MTPEEYQKRLNKIAEKSHAVQLRMEAVWPQHALSVHMADGVSADAHREALHALLDERLDLIAALEHLRREAGFPC